MNNAHTTSFTKLIYRYFRSYNGLHQAYIPILPLIQRPSPSLYTDTSAHTTAFTKLIYRYFRSYNGLHQAYIPILPYNGLHQAYIPILPVNYAHTTAFTKLIYRYFHMHMYQSWIILHVQRHPESLYTSVSISVSSIRRVHTIHNCILYTPIYGTMKEI